MKITKQEVLNLFEGLNKVSNLGGAKFAYAVSRNIAKLKPEVILISETQEKYFSEYEKERKTLAELNAIKVDGKPKIENGKYVVENQEVFNEEFKKLQEKYKSVNDEFDSFLKDEIEVDLHIIPASYLPETITAEQINGILPIIEEEKK